MTEPASMPVTPDGITGMIFAAEGIKNTVVLLNGPMGCRFYHSTTSQFLSIHPLLYMPSASGRKVPVDYQYLDNWFFRQQRVPCSWLDGDDYVFGSVEKVREGIRYLRENIDFELLAVINSPGTSLIGDRIGDLVQEMLPDKAAVVLESPGFSVDFDYGYEQACLQLLQQNADVLRKARAADADVLRKARASDADVLRKARTADADRASEADETKEPCTRPRVNVLGLSIWDRYFEGDREEIESMLSDCGIQVNCFLAADCTLEQIRSIPLADLNVVLDAGRAKETAAWLERCAGMPCYICETLPVGFDAAEKLCLDLCERLGTSPERLMAKSRKARALAWYKIDGIYHSSGLPQGAYFAMAGRLPLVHAYTAFLMEYLGMVPDALTITGDPGPSGLAKLKQLLDTYRAGAALETPLTDTKAEIVLSDANHISALMTCRQAFCGIEIALPGMGYTDLVSKTHLGIRGALFLTEQVLNGLMTRLSG